MKQFKDFTIEDFIGHTSMKDATRPSGKMPHVSYFRTTSDKYRNINNPTGTLTEAILSVPSTRTSRSKTIIEEKPNDTTLAAMREVESGRDAGEVCLESLDSFVASMM